MQLLASVIAQPTGDGHRHTQEIPVIKIYCASYAYSGVWAFSPEAIKAFAPKEMLTRGEFSSGEIWEAELKDLDKLWAFSPVC